MKTLHYQSVDSTNLEARRLWQQGKGEGGALLVTAEQQTAGLGRSGRTWKSPHGGIWMTLAWPVEQSLHKAQALPLAVAHALASVLEQYYQLESLIKWPNDVLVRGRKIAGILCQSDSALIPPCILVGVGVNGNFRVESLGEGMRVAATSLLEECGDETDLELFRQRFVHSLEAVLQHFDREGLSALLPGLRRRLAWQGEDVRATDTGSSEEITGVLEGINDQGCLMLRIDGKIRTFFSGELERLVPSPQGNVTV